MDTIGLILASGRLARMHGWHKGLRHPVQLTICPGVSRGFGFLPHSVHGFADKLATKDSLLGTVDFMRPHLQK